MPRDEQFRLPDAGEGLTEAEIVEWKVAVGDRVRINQVLVEIETAKSLVELPSPFDGVVKALLAAPGETVEVGVPIITVDTDPDGPPAPAGDPTTGATAGGEPDDAPGGAVLVGYGVSGHAAQRRVRHGRQAASAEQGDRAARQETSATPAGIASPSAAASVGAPDPAHLREPVRERTQLTGSTSAAHEAQPVLAKPPVRKLAKDLGVDLATIHPSGPGGIVTREDVVARATETQPQSLATYAGDDQPWLASGTVAEDGRTTRVPVKSVRKRTAEAMVTSAFTAPHVSVFHTVDVTRTMRLVARLREDREFADVRVTPLLIAIKALLIAVHRHPEVNASWIDETQEIVYKHYINLGIAAQTPRGLVVPNIKDAHRLGLRDLAIGIAELTAKARAGSTTPADMSDGTITITNVGVFGIDTGTPILNPGESAILAFGAIREQPWVHKGKIRKRHVTQLALSFDHRLVDGGLGSRVLADVAAVLQDPASGLVWG